MNSVLINGKKHQLGKRIGRGGEGDVFLLAEDSSVAVKIYTLSSLGDREEKIRAFIEEKLFERASQVAFPIAEVLDSKNGVFLGFTMRMVANYKPLHELYAPGSRKIHFPQADYRFLIRAASNIARAVASVHANGCVIGDINHSGILVSEKAMASLIDADSFQVKSKRREFLCKVGVPEYTPPELQGGSLEGVIRSSNHDAFGLAVVLFLLLFMGRHPFVGTVRRGEIPPLHENIKNFKYAYTDLRNVGMDQPPGTPTINDFSPQLASYFDKAFSPAGVNGRPSAGDWIKVLDEIESKLIKCPDNALHYVPQGSSECAWCDMERQYGTVLFLPYFFSGSNPTNASANTFDVEAVWRVIEGIKKSVDGNLNPKFKVAKLQPSEIAKKSKNGSHKNQIYGAGLVIGSIIGIFVIPPLFVVWLFVLFAGIGTYKEKPSIDEEQFLSTYKSCEITFVRELENWNKKYGIDQFISLYKELASAYEEYKETIRYNEKQIADYKNNRRDLQLRSYLDTFTINQSSIKGVGPAKRAVLASYGIDTAADIEKNRLLKVPGFGETNSLALIEWRSKLETRFVYQPNQTNSDLASISQLKLQAENKLKPLRDRLAAGPQRLQGIASLFKSVVILDNSSIFSAKNNLDQAKTDLEFLGISIPQIKNNSSSLRPIQVSSGVRNTSNRVISHAPINVKGNSATTSSSKSVNCPRCGSSMVKRLAKRGRNAGHYFWGCSRYSAGCKGTRNI